MIEVRLPQPVEGQEESLIVLWFVSEGDKVEKGDRLVEVETETELMVIEAEESGTVREIVLERGETAKVGEVLAKIEPIRSEATVREERKEDEPLVEERKTISTPGFANLQKSMLSSWRW